MTLLTFVCLFAIDIMKSKSNPDFMKKQSKQPRGVRSKVSVKFLFPRRRSVSDTNRQAEWVHASVRRVTSCSSFRPAAVMTVNCSATSYFTNVLYSWLLGACLVL